MRDPPVEPPAPSRRGCPPPSRFRRQNPTHTWWLYYQLQKIIVNYTLNIEFVGTKEAASGKTRYIHKVTGSKVSMDKFHSDIEASNKAEEITNGVIGTDDLLYFYSRKIPAFLQLKRADNGQWYPDESLLEAMNWAAEKYPNLTPAMLLALVQGA